MKLPIYIENSRVPKILSYLAPIDIWAINLGPFVWCRGEYTEVLKRHEGIHWEQQKELLIVGQWLLYICFYLRNLIRLGWKDRKAAYRSNPFEMEAYRNEYVVDYIKIRKKYEWMRYI